VSAVFAVVVRRSSSERLSFASESRRSGDILVTPTIPNGAPAASNSGRAMDA
jgi:hypothetical protein